MSQIFTSLSLRIRTLETEQYHTHDFQGLSHVLLCDPLVHKKKSKSFYAIKVTVSCPIQNIFSTFTQNQLLVNYQVLLHHEEKDSHLL